MSSRRAFFGTSKDVQDCNIVILGALGVGKSALTVKYLTRRFIVEYDPNIEDTYQKTESIDGQEFSVRIMDTSDSSGKKLERFMKWAHGVIIAYSITNKSTFDTALQLLQNVSQYSKDTGKEVPVILVGNQTDLAQYRAVSKLEGEEAATSYDCLFQETSAAEDYFSVEKIFHELIRDISKTNDPSAQDTLQPLFIFEESGKGGSLLNPLGGMIHKRTKTSSAPELKNGGTGSDKELRAGARRMPSTFRLFNRRFNIFN